MAPYDSDSSGGEEEDYTETNVLLGYAGKEPQDDTISYLGGEPTWIDPTTPPSASLAKCKVCNDLMVLILQLNADSPSHFPGHERRLYILTCRRKTCRRKEGSIRALRGTRIAESASKPKAKEPEKEKSKPEPTKPTVNLGESLFGAKPSTSGNPFATGSNPFSTGTGGNTFSNPFAAAGLPTSELAAKPPQNPSPSPEPTSSETAKDTLPKTFASALSLNNSQSPAAPTPPPHEPWPTNNLPSPYPLYYLVDADYETLDKEPLPPPPQATIVDDTPDSSSGGKEDKEVFESTHDTTFQKFADRLSQNPEQVIRYEFRGSPLLYSKIDSVGKIFADAGKGNEKVKVSSGSGNGKIPRCANCGAGRVFEVQVTPHAIMELEREEKGLDGMDWGTVIVGVCDRDCVPTCVESGKMGYVEEWAGVQWEELGGKK
ncbi:2d7e5965-15a1-45d2-8a00-0d4fa3cd0cf8 [Sclerotinia trifoliorum]|uniref:2d7e5965-15a1-45d2-8a00-0d4fa3cd0cf8 n=1 Tax=Sclerotinia trifoliorum TaxID=28548 RepID=A0A8H2VRR6_9HELO|nr:2d7e5965-15a1-45d2-8a00-0d4fa3cd0cf8 [Sclerotinia trifoliorum]